MKLIDQIDYVLKGITGLAKPQDGKFNHPADKKRTKQNTEQMIRAEKNIHLFWKEYDKNWKRLTSQSIEDTMGVHVPYQRGQPLQRTDPWVELFKQKPEAKKEPKKSVSFQQDQLPIQLKPKLKPKGIGHPAES